MKKIWLACLLAGCLANSQAQLTTPPDGGNKKATVGERIGITDVTIHYDRPGVKGREGKIWGQLVEPGFNDLGFGTSKASPWRAGANENTTIEFSTPVKIEGQDLPAGKYGFFIAYDPQQCTLIFSKNNSSWGSFFYNPAEDALRVTVKPVTLDQSVEWLRYEFLDEAADAATIALEWEKLRIPFRVQVDLDNLQFESFRRELRGERSFNPGWQSFHQAAQYAADKNKNLEEGLAWAEQAVSGRFIGEANFQTLSTKATLLSKLGRQAEADSTMQQALAHGNMQQLHNYGRQLLNQQKNKEALDVFLMNYKNNPNQFIPLVGLARGYAANGDNKKALQFAKKALPLAPDDMNRKNLETMIEKLQGDKK